MKLLFLVAEDSYFCTHRINLGKAARLAGFEVAVATRCQTHKQLIEEAGIKVFPLKHFNRSGMNPGSQYLALQELYTIYKEYMPDVVHHVGMKPVIFGTLVAKRCKVPRIINALGGLGYLFTDSKRTLFLARLKKSILRLGISRLLDKLHEKPNVSLILQNQDDIATLLKATRIPVKRLALIRGAGVDTRAFPFSQKSLIENLTIVTCISRMLWDKGIGELVEAASIIQAKKLPIQIVLYGMPDAENPASIDIEQLKTWDESKKIIWKGHCDNVAKAYAECHIAVLPSYREGLPKSLLEAASLGRPIVTTNVPGCKEIVQHEKNGLLVPAQNAQALADALIRLSQDIALQEKMGLESRKLVETYFSDTIIHQQTIALYQTPSPMF